MDYNAQYQLYLDLATKALEEASNDCFLEQSDVCDAAKYSLFAGGKRVRAVLCVAVCDMLGGDTALAAKYAAAVEMLHCYSLIHDDLPCMDNDDFRRGKPSCHKKHGEATALLAGDALLTAAFSVLARADGTAAQNSNAVAMLAQSAGAKGMIHGQELDLLFETKQASQEQLNQIHHNKTGMLINAAIQLGAIASNSSNATAQILEEYAFSIGLVFQIVDDVLDVTSTQEVLGKPIGSDVESEKTTFVSLFGVEKSMEMAIDITSKACERMDKQFAIKAAFLCTFANTLLKRNN